MEMPNKEVIRDRILYYLALIYPQSATLPLLQGELDLFGYPVPVNELESHLGYLVVKELVSREEHVRRHQHEKYAPVRKVSLVKITAKGIDYCDGRLPADEGIYLPPRQ